MKSGQLKLDGGEKMRKIKSFLLAILSAGSLLSLTATPAFAVSLCPGGQFSPLCTNVIDAGGLVSIGLNVLLFVAFVAALAFLIIGGIRWILSGGDKEGTAKARSTVTSALIGLVVVLAAWILINIILKFFNLPGVNDLQLPSIGGIGQAGGAVGSGK